MNRPRFAEHRGVTHSTLVLSVKDT